MLRFLLATTALVALVQPAQADPVSIGTLLLTALGAGDVAGTAIIGGVTIASVVGSITITAIGIGLSLLFAPKPPKPTPVNGIVPVQTTIPFRIYGYGPARLAGALMFKEENAGYLGYVAALNSHKVSAFKHVFLNDDQVIVPASGWQLVGNVSAMTDNRYANNLIAIDTRRGLSTETAHGSITTRFATFWDSNYRGDGIASLSMLCAPIKQDKFTTEYPYGAPSPSVVIDQYLVYDPRDGAQDPADESTWTFSDNAALCYLHFRCFSEFGSQKNYATSILPLVDRWIEAANVCDEARALKAGGTELAYRTGGWMTTEQDRRTCEQTLRACFDGWSVDRGDGTIDVEAGKYYEPDVILTDVDIMSWTGQRGVATKDKINRLTAKYTYPDAGYLAVETDPINDTADQAVRPGPSRASQIDLSWVNWTGQASRLLKRESIRQAVKRRGQLVLWLSGLNAAYARRVRIQSNSIPGLSNAVLEISKPVISIMSGTVTVNYIVLGDEIDAYDPATDESRPPPVPTRPESIGTPIPASVSVVAEQIDDGNGSAVVVLSVSWDVPLNGADPITTLSYTVQYRDHDTVGDWVQQTFSTPTISGGRVSVQTSPVPPNSNLDVEVSSTGTSSSESDFSTPVVVNTDITSTAPGVPTGFTATGASGHADLHCVNPNSGNFDGVQFYRSAHGIAFGSAIAVGPEQFGAANSTSDYSDTVAAGTYDYWVVAKNSGGVASAPSGPVTATVT